MNHVETWKASSKLLVVDDDDPNRDLMVRRLLKCGFEASHANSGKCALEWINSHTVDLVLLDVEMPEMSGLDVLTTLRQTYTPAQLPIIMVTGKSGSARMRGFSFSLETTITDSNAPPS